MILFLLIIALDLRLFILSFDPLSYSVIRELLFGLIVFLLIWGTGSLAWFQNRTLLQKLRFFGIAVILFWVAKKLLSVDLKIFPSVSDTETISSPLRLILIFGIVFFSVWIWNAMKELIYIQRGKRTQSNFRLMLIFVIITMAYAMGNIINLGVANWNLGENSDTIFKSVLYGLVIFIAFINGFRCKWIHYLNKNQKVGFFFFFLIINLFASDLLISSKSIIQDYSPLYHTFYQCLIFICTIYSGMGLLGILFLLPSAGMMDRRIREIQTLHTLSATIGSVFDID